MGGHRSSSVCSIAKNGKYRHYSKNSSVTSRGGPKTPPESSDDCSDSRSESSYSVRSRSRSYSPEGRRRRYESPSYLRGSHYDRYRSRDKPKPNRCIGVFGLSVYTTQHKVRELFDKFGPIERIQMVVDQQTGRSRGFCFIYYENLSDAKAAKEECCGIEVDDRRIRVDYSITQRPHTPTPGIYMGHATRYVRCSAERSGGCRSHAHRFKERHSDHHRHRRHRSRSYTPCKGSRSRRHHHHKRRRSYCSRSMSHSRSRSPASRRSRYY